MTQSPLMTLKAARVERSGLTKLTADEVKKFGDIKQLEIPGSPLHEQLTKNFPDGWVVKHDGTIVGYGSRCRLRPYGKGDSCPEGLTGHHVVPDRCFREGGRDARSDKRILSEYKGLVICLEGPNSDPAFQHGKAHVATDNAISNLADDKGLASLADVEKVSAAGAAGVSNCNQKDIEDQLSEYHKKQGLGPERSVRASYDGDGIMIADLKKKATENIRQAPKM